MIEVESIENQIINADCMDILKQSPDKCIDLVLTDPPYKLVSGSGKNRKITMKNVSIEKINNGSLFENNTIKFSEWLPEIYRILKNNAHCYIFINYKNMNKLLNECKKNKLELLNILVWEKNIATPTQYYMKNNEFILFLKKGKAKYINNIGTKSILKYNNVKNKIHPTEKPIPLLECLIKNSTNENDLILDCFSGSGTTAVAAHNLKRRFICIEKDKDYYDASVERLKNAQAQMKLF